MAEYRVVVICPQRLIREGLCLMLAEEEELDVLGAVPDAKSALTLMMQARPDVVVLFSAAGDCLAAVSALRASWPALPLLVVSGAVLPEAVQVLLQAGVSGYMPTEASVDELVRAVYSVGRGERAIHPTILLGLLSHLSTQEQESEPVALDALSPREREVLSYLARGLCDRDIAQELFISVRTVQTHLSHIYAKLGVHSRIEAALIAVREGWFVAPPSGLEAVENQ